MCTTSSIQSPTGATSSIQSPTGEINISWIQSPTTGEILAMIRVSKSTCWMNNFQKVLTKTLQVIPHPWVEGPLPLWQNAFDLTVPSSGEFPGVSLSPTPLVPPPSFIQAEKGGSQLWWRGISASTRSITLKMKLTPMRAVCYCYPTLHSWTCKSWW